MVVPIVLFLGLNTVCSAFYARLVGPLNTVLLCSSSGSNKLNKCDFLDGLFLEDYVKALVDNTLNTLNQNDINVENNIICLQQLIDTCFNYRELQSKSFFENIKIIKDHDKLTKKLKFKIMDILHC